MTIGRYSTHKYGAKTVSILLRLAESVNAAMTYQEVIEAVAPIFPDCQGVYLNLWQHLDYDQADYMEVAAAASIAEELILTTGQRLNKTDFPFVYETRFDRLVVVEDVDADDRIDDKSRQSYETLTARAFVRVSFRRGRRLLGAIFFKYSHPRRFTEQERRIALGIADLVLAAIDRIRLAQETANAIEAQRQALQAEKEAREELGLLYRTSELVHAASTLQDVVRAITPLVHEIEKVNLLLWEHLDYRKADYFEVAAGINAQGEVTPATGQRHRGVWYPITLQMAKLRQLAIDNIFTHPLVDPLTRANWEADKIKALLMVRLVQDERWYGVLSFESTHPRLYSERDCRLTLAISDLVLSAVIRIRTQQELAAAVEAERNAFLAEQAAREEMSSLYEISTAINRATNMAEVLAATLLRFKHPIHVAIFAWENYDRQAATYLECVASNDTRMMVGTRLPREIVLGGVTLDAAEIIVANDISSPEWVNNPAADSARYFNMHSIAYANLIHAQRFQGILALAVYEEYHFEPQETRLLMAIADLTAAALERFRLRQAEQEALQDREQLLRASQAINAASSYQEILDAVKHIDFDGGTHYLYIFENFNHRDAMYIETVATSADTFMKPGELIPISDLPFLKSHPRAGLCIYEDIPHHPELDDITRATLLKQGTLSNLRFGLEWRGRMLGSLGVDHPRIKQYTAREKRLMTALGELVSAAVERIRLQGEMYAAKERAERLAERAQQLAALEERTHLARELHDSVSQALYGIGLGAQTAQRFLDTNPDYAKESVDYILALAEAGLAEMRALIFELRPESLATEGLMVALAKQAASLQARHEVDVQISLIAEPDLSLSAKESLYRVLREALHNVIKHASATQIRLNMTTIDSHLTFEITDNGIGFDVNRDYPGHLGLHSMRERMHQLGGQIKFESEPGHGTRLTVRLPT